MKNRRRFAYFTGASVNYLPGLWALIRSIDYHRNPQKEIPDIYVSGHGLQNIQFPENVKIFNVTAGDQVKATAIRRFELAVEFGRDYSAICLTDADQFLTHDVQLFFNLAQDGYIVTGSNGMQIAFGPEYQAKYKIDLGSKPACYTKIHTTTPTFLSSKHLDWFETFLKYKDEPYFDDFTFLNLMGYYLGKDSQMVCYPPYAFTGIHHWQLKPETALIRKDGMIFSGTEELVYMIHGKWWEQGWREGVMSVLEQYLRNSGFDRSCFEKSKNAFRISLNEFQKFCY